MQSLLSRYRTVRKMRIQRWMVHGSMRDMSDELREIIAASDLRRRVSFCFTPAM